MHRLQAYAPLLLAASEGLAEMLHGLHAVSKACDAMLSEKANLPVPYPDGPYFAEGAARLSSPPRKANEAETPCALLHSRLNRERIQAPKPSLSNKCAGTSVPESECGSETDA
jgi:hypothetical protein